MLLHFLKEKGVTNYPRIWLSPDFDPVRFSNALSAFGHNISPQDIVLQIDDSVFGNGKTGCLVCRDRIYLREPFSDTVCLPFRTLRQLQGTKGKLFINHRQAYSFCMPETHDIDFIFTVLNDWVCNINAGENTGARPSALSRYSGKTSLQNNRAPLRPDSDFQELLADLQARSRQLGEAESGAYPDDLPSREFAAQVLTSTMHFTDQAFRYDAANWSAQELRELTSNEMILQSLSFAVAYLGHRLVTEAGYNDDEIQTVTLPLMVHILMRFCLIKAETLPPTLRLAARPETCISDSEFLQTFRAESQFIAGTLSREENMAECLQQSYLIVMSEKNNHENTRPVLEKMARQPAELFGEKLANFCNSLETDLVTFLQQTRYFPQISPHGDDYALNHNTTCRRRAGGPLHPFNSSCAGLHLHIQKRNVGED